MSIESNTDEALRVIMADGIAARDELQRRQDAVKTAANRSIVGKRFKYLNSYGSGEKWWLYRRVLSVTGDRCTAFEFQHTSENIVEIKLEKHGFLGDGWEEIPEHEYRAAWSRVMSIVTGGYAMAPALPLSQTAAPAGEVRS